ncbi:MAG: hypothetical protein M3083_02970 [Actinomycetota bacterium]|nr:hypothetical protein [Actinomycetota bacterium]
MVTSSESSSTPALDEWIATDGQDHALAAVENLRNAVNDGAVPVLRDEASLRAYWDSRRRQTA